nr:integrase, catalytic region, zinc finger, CCHC-type, peptidase aspartic, catalytic [Tanacetum cinerariifolium]
MVEETTFLKQNFKQKENKLLADFLNMKSLKEKVEDSHIHTLETTDSRTIYWSNDLMKLKSEALKERAKVSRPMKAFTVITPSAITDGERGFEQTKACYLQEVIPFLQTIKDKFEGIQKALTREVKQMKDVFEELEAKVAQLRTNESQLTKVTDPVTNLQAQTDCLRAGNDKVKQHYKQLYDSIKITRAKHIKQVTKLTAKNVTLKTSVSKAKVQPPALTRTKHAVDVEPIVPRRRNNRETHLDYLRHLKESVETICDIVEEAKVVRPLDRSIVSAYRYTQHSQELLEYAIATCPPSSQPRATQLAYTPLIRKKQVTAMKPFDRLNSNKNKHVVTKKIQK